MSDFISQLIGGLHGGHRHPYSQALGSALGQSGWANYGAQQASLAQFANQYASLSQANAVTTLPASPIENAGIRAGEIIAHRAWRCTSFGILQSMAASAVWATNEPMQGDPDANLGVHAFKSQRGALECYGVAASRDHVVVIGTIALWGEVIEHERGYRAEFGKVHSVDLICGIGWWRERRLLKRVRERYGLGT